MLLYSADALIFEDVVAIGRTASTTTCFAWFQPQRDDRSPDEKLRWLIDEGQLFLTDVHHEVFRLIEKSL